MNYVVRIPVCTFLLLCLFSIADAGAASLESRKNTGVYLNEISAATGYCRGELKKEYENFAVYPLLARIGFNINSLAGIDGSRNTLQLGVEPFVNIVAASDHGVETGLGVGLRYYHNCFVPFDLFIEASAAPIFLSIASIEQGNPGFNFLLQSGVGFQYKLTDRNAFFAGYRFRHISNGGLVAASNSGINSDAIIAGLSWLY